MNILLRILPGWVTLFALVPDPAYMGFLGNWLHVRYCDAYEAWELAVVRYHERRLIAIDPQYKGYFWKHEGRNLIFRRNRALAAGMDPLDPRYPERDSVIQGFKSLRHL